MIAPLRSVPVGKAPGQLGTWLRSELVSRGYDLARGGQSRFARESNVHVSIINRVLTEDRVPEYEALRRIGATLGRTLGDMLIVAGVATLDDMPVRTDLTVADAVALLRREAAEGQQSLVELLLAHGVDASDLIPIPMSDPIVAEIEESDLHDETKTALIELHLENRKRRFDEARQRRKPGA